MAADAHPPGWDYNPSAWSQRLPLVAVASLGLLIASTLALYQYGVIAHVWEPFFGEGSRRVLTSGLSRLLPVTDATLGAMSYGLDAIAGVLGGTGRWRTSPWLVVVFSLAVGPLGLVSVLLVISQPLVVGAWCTLCLCSALISLSLIGPAMDELLASLQHLARRHRAGDSLWRAFWGIEDTRCGPES